MADSTLQRQHREAVQLTYAHELEQAVSKCRRILAHFPRHIGTYRVLGQIYLALGHYDRAADLFRRVLGADPEDVLAYAGLGTVYCEKGLLEQAIWHYLRAFELSPGNGEIRRELLALFARTDLGPRRVGQTCGSLARTYVRGRLLGKAIGELRSILREEPERHDLRVMLLELLWRQGQLDEAEEVGRDLLEELPECLKANLIVGSIWLKVGREEQGRELLQQAQSLDPQNKLAQEVLGGDSPLPPRVVRLPLEDKELPPLGLDYLDEDADVLPASSGVPRTIDAEERPRSADTRGSNSEESFAELRRRLEADPRDMDARLALARGLRDVGDLEESLKVYEGLLRGGGGMERPILHDLELLNMLYPGNAALHRLLVMARSRAAESLDE